MRVRIALHQSRRGDRWSTLEVPLNLPEALRENCQADRIILVDCLTLWLSNLMAAERDLHGAFDALLAALEESNGHVVLVSNEVGLGIVPMNKLARDFRDHAGRLNQTIAKIADVAVFMAAGLPMTLKAPDGWQPPRF
jgi:adenosylcobinamide kinase/adenosylcobinamide-phosphate guanylyltransferase